TEIGPLAGIRLAENYGSSVAKLPHDEGIMRRGQPDHCERAGGGHHAVAGVDIVLDKDWNAVHRTAGAFRLALLVERLRACLRLRAYLITSNQPRSARKSQNVSLVSAPQQPASTPTSHHPPLLLTL